MLGMPEHGHEPVMVGEVLVYLDVKPGQVVMDCTAGRGGHALKIAEAETSAHRRGYAEGQAAAKLETERQVAEAMGRIAASWKQNASTAFTRGPK